MAAVETSSSLPSTSRAGFISSNSTRRTSSDDNIEEDDDELFEQLEAEIDDAGNDAFMAGYREKRLDQLKQEMQRVQTVKADEGYGRLSVIKVEKDVIQSTLKHKRTVIHFFHPDFRRCRIMDKHLENLAARHRDTRFVRADVANVPFLVVKLEIKVLPCVICFVDGITKDKLVGFDDVGNGTGDNFTTVELEVRLAHSGVIDRPTTMRDGAIQRPSYG